MGRATLNPQVRIRAAARDDLGAVAGIFGWYAEHTVATFEESARPERDWAELLARLPGLGLPFLVAETAGEVAGYAYAGPWRAKPGYRYTAEDSVFVAHGQTGRGIGSALLAALLDGCARGPIRQLVAVIADAGEPGSAAAGSVALHEAFGFTAAGRLRAVGFKHGQWIDTLLLQRAV